MGVAALPELSLEAGDPILLTRSGCGGVPGLGVSVTEEHGGGHGRSDGGPAGGLRFERVLALGDLGSLTPVTVGERIADPLEGSSPVVERSHWDGGDPTDRTERTDLWSGGKWTG